MSNRERNVNGIVKCENDVKEGWVLEDYGNEMSLILQIGSKTLHPNMNFGLHYYPK